MKAVTTYTPTEGATQPIVLPLQSGYYEVINDSNYLLLVIGNTGTCYQVPGQVQIYPTPNQGGTISIQALPLHDYLAIDLGISNNITINQFLEGETYGQSWPYFLTRSVDTATNTALQQANTGLVAALSSGITVTLTVNIPADGTVNLFLTACDLSIDSESTAHSFTFSLGQFLGAPGNFQYVGHTVTSGSFQLPLRWEKNPPVVQAANGVATVTASIGAVSGSSARASINLIGYVQ